MNCVPAREKVVQMLQDDNCYIYLCGLKGMEEGGRGRRSRCLLGTWPSIATTRGPTIHWHPAMKALP